MAWSDVENTGGKKEKIPYTKFPEGGTRIRILDGEPYSFWQHWFPKQNTAATCLGKDCPVCNVIAQAKANKVTPIYNSSHRHALRIWNYTTNQMEIMIQGRTFMQNLLMWHKEMGDLREYDVKVVRSGSGTNTTYNIMPMTPSPFDTEDKLIEEVDMEEQFKAPTKEEMRQLIEGKTWAEISGVDENEDVA